MLLEMREEVEQLKVVRRLCQDVKAFGSFAAFEQAVEHALEIARQNEGWLRSQRQGHGQNRRARGASRAGRAMITRSLSRLREEATGRSPGEGRGASVSSLAAAGPGAWVRPRAGPPA